MKASDQKATDTIKYNYWIYMLTCLSLEAAAIDLSHSGDEPEFNYFNIVSALTLRFVFISLAWVIGKRYGLNYVWLCLLGGLGLGLPSLIQEFFFYLSLDSFEVVTFLILGILFMGIAILIISYPFQVIFSKIR